MSQIRYFSQCFVTYKKLKREPNKYLISPMNFVGSQIIIKSFWSEKIDFNLMVAYRRNQWDKYSTVFMSYYCSLQEMFSTVENPNIPLNSTIRDAQPGKPSTTSNIAG
jgi:hypothetical protein